MAITLSEYKKLKKNKQILSGESDNGIMSLSEYKKFRESDNFINKDTNENPGVNKNTSGLFQSSDAFDDGYQFGDVTKTIGSSVGDLLVETGKGFEGTIEGVTDWAQYKISDALKFFGLKDAAKAVKENAEFNSTGALFGENEDDQNLFKTGWTEDLNKNSVVGDFGDSIAEGVGNVGAMIGLGAMTGGVGTKIGLSQTAAGVAGSAFNSFTSAYGNARSEAYRNGADDKTARTTATISGLSEAISEQFFDAIPGMKTAGWGGKLIDKVSGGVKKVFGSGAGKIAYKVLENSGEGFEEIISNVLQATGNDIAHLIDNNYNYGMENQTGNVLKDSIGAMTSKESWEAFLSASLTSAICNGGNNFITNTQKNKIINAYAKENNMTTTQVKKMFNQNVKDVVNNEVSNNPNMKVSEQIEAEDNAKFDTMKYMDNNSFVKFGDETKPYEYKESNNEIENYVNKKIADKGFNNTSNAHYIANLLIKARTDLGVDVDVTNNQEIIEQLKEIKKQEFGRELSQEEIKDIEDLAPRVNGTKIGGKLVLNVDSKEAGSFIIGHEIKHFLEEDKEGNDAINKALFAYAKSLGVLENDRARTARIYEGVEDANIDDELTADYIGEYFKDKKFVRSLSQENPTLFEKVFNAIKKVFSNNNQKLDNAVMDTFREVYNDYSKKYKERNLSQGTTDINVASAIASKLSDKIEAKPQDSINTQEEAKQGTESAKNDNKQVNLPIVEENKQETAKGEESYDNNDLIRKKSYNEIKSIVDNNSPEEAYEKIYDRYLEIEELDKSLSNQKYIENGSYTQEALDLFTKRDYERLLLSDLITKSKEGKINYKGTILEEVEQIIQEEENLPTEHKLNNAKGIETIKTKYDGSTKETGKSTSIILSNGDKLSGTYKLVEAGSVTPSHNSENFSKSTGFPTTEQGTTVNDRDYESDKNARAMVVTKASNYDGRAFSDNGVIVSKDGIVVSGNDRTMAGEIAAKLGTDSEYINYLKEHCEDYGFTKEQIDNMKHPRIVLELDNDIEYNTKNFAKFNKDAKKTKSVAEKAKEIGKTIDNKTINAISNVFDNYDTIDEVYNSEKGTRELLTLLQNKGIIDSTEISEIYNGERLTGTGKDLVESIVLGSVVSESNVKYFSNNNELKYKFMKAAPAIIANRSLGEYSINDILNNAIDVYKKASSDNRTIDEFTRQENIFQDNVVDELIEGLAKKLEKKGYKNLNNFMNKYNEMARPAAAGQGDLLLGGKVETREQILKRALEIDDESFSLSDDLFNNEDIEGLRSHYRVLEEQIKKATGDEKWMLVNEQLKTQDYIDKLLEKNLPKGKDIKYSISDNIPLEKRVNGDELLDAQDLIEEIKNVGANVDNNGYVTLYHTTTDESAKKIKETGKMFGKENGIFFSTSKTAQQSEGRGGKTLEFRIPAEKLILDDIFSDNADVKIPLKNTNVTLDIKDYLVDDTKFSISDNKGRKLTKEQQDYFKDSKVKDEDGNLLEVYHGTPSGGFNTFERNKTGATTDSKDSKLGFYFSDNENLAETFKNFYNEPGTINEDGEIKAVYLKITKPLRIDMDLSNKEIADILYITGVEDSTDIDEDTIEEYKDNLYFTLQNDGDNAKNEFKSEIAKGIDRAKELGYDGYIGNIVNTDTLMMKDRGYEEVKGKEYIVFDSNQIKNITNSNPTSNPDIRFSLKDNLSEDAQREIRRYVGLSNEQLDKEFGYAMDSRDSNQIEYNKLNEENKKFISSQEFRDAMQDYLHNETPSEKTNELMEKANKDADKLRYFDKCIKQYNAQMEAINSLLNNEAKDTRTNDEIVKEAEKHFGTTNNFKETAYITTNGKNLDFSGKNEGAMPGSRNKDHREINEIDTTMDDFVKMGNVRLKPEGNGFEVSTMPNEKQISKLYDYIYQANGEIYVDVVKPNDVYDSATYKQGTPANKIISDLKEYFDKGSFPKKSEYADFFYSLSKNGERHQNTLKPDYDTSSISDAKFNLPTQEETNLPTVNNEKDEEEKPSRKKVIAKNRMLANRMLGDIFQIKDKKKGILYQLNTMKRNLRDIMKPEQAKKMYNEYFKPITTHNAEIEKDITSYNERIQKYNLTNEESTYVQMWGEFLYNPESELLNTDIENYYNKNKGKIDLKKSRKATEEFRNIYDELIKRINTELTRNGYKEIEYRKGYFPHFIEEKATSPLGKLAEKLGWKVKQGTLPTDIAGITDQFKPGKVWTSFSQQRTGDATDYNSLKGLDNYLRGAMDIIHHTEDIQKLRALENEIRYQYSEKGVKEKIDKIYDDDSLDIDEKNERIAELTQNIKNSALGNFATELKNYTDNLANKKAFGDRSMEQAFGRDTYSIMQNINGRVSANMVGANISSAMTNFIPLTQCWGECSTKNLMRGIYESIKTSIKSDGFENNSTYLINRTQQADRLYKTGLEKINDKLGIPFETIDSFTSNAIVRAKYYDNIDNGMSEQQAMDNADEFAKDVMAGRSKGDAPTIMNQKNPLMKLVTAFQLEVNNQYGYMFKDLPVDLGDEAKEKLVMAFVKMFLGAFLYNQLSEKITGRKSAFSPIDMAIDDVKTATNENMDLGEKISKIATETAKELPFVGGVMGGGRLPIQSAIPYENPLSMVTSTLSDASKAFDEDESKRKTAINNLTKEWSKPLYYVAMPFAGGQLKKTVEGISMYNENLPIAGSYTNSGKLRFEADTSTLGKAQAAIFGQYASKNARDYFDNGYTALTEKQINEALDSGLNINDYRDYRQGLKQQETTSDKVDYIYNLPLENEQKNVLVNNALNRKNDIDLSNYGDYSSLEEFDYATKNPNKYTAITQVTDYGSFNEIKDEIDNIKDSYDNASVRKQAVREYINSLRLNQYQKIMLEHLAGGYSITNFKYSIRTYIQSLEITKEEKENIDSALFD